MKATYKKIFLISLCSLLSINAFADVAGNYQCTRTDPNNSNTSYPLSITKTGDTYTLQWADANGFPTVYGTGVLISANSGSALSVVYWDSKDSNVFGGEVFAVKPDGSLSGTWALQSTNKLGTEACKKS
jgi:hypothetical protein